MCKHSSPTVATRELRQTLGQYPTGVAIVTCYAEATQPVGLTINSFSSILLAPPLVAWCIDRSARSYTAFASAGGFTVSVLTREQEALANRFARRGNDKFRGIDCDPIHSPLGPVIPRAAAWLHCRVYQRITLGDHTMLVGEVLQHRRNPQPPLVFAAGMYQQLSNQEEAIA